MLIPVIYKDMAAVHISISSNDEAAENNMITPHSNMPAALKSIKPSFANSD